MAREQAAARWRQAGARGYADYLSFLTTALYRRWGAAFARANARVRITRLRLVGSRGRRADAVRLRRTTSIRVILYVNEVSRVEVCMKLKYEVSRVEVCV